MDLHAPLLADPCLHANDLLSARSLTLEPKIVGRQTIATIFATQLDGTGQNGPVRRRGGECVLGPKTLTNRHAIEPGGMATVG